MNKRIIFLVMFGIFLVGIVSAAQVSYCCERTDLGVWCQNAEQEQCDDNYLSAPTSCESTSFCRLGVCINNQEGDCMPNSPERVCVDDGGVWDIRKKEAIPQCQLGCCLLGDQAAFVTLTRCRSLASSYGLDIDYRTDITSEVECISSASAEEMGACVYEKEFERTCEMITKAECQERDANFQTEFYTGYLCSAESLNTVCAPRGGTTCVDGKDGVYFLDTCGNVANVYDYAKLNDVDYWTYIRTPDCTLNMNNVNSKRSCGNCDYYQGNTCKKPERGNSPSYGSYICEDLGCTYEGQTYNHGETWCATDKEAEETNSPGGSNSRLVCYDGEVTVEPCAEFRQEVCSEGDVNGFSTAACIPNRWQDCYAQDNQDDCENGNNRDCVWESTSCSPLYAPGFNFWEEGDAESVCALASKQCNVVYEAGIGEGFFGTSGAKGKAYDLDCIRKCQAENILAGGLGLIGFCTSKPECKSACANDNGEINTDWMNNANNLCVSLGDCGMKNNYLGQEGYYDDILEDFVSRTSG